MKDSKLGIFRKIGWIISHPVRFFEKTAGEGVWPPLKLYWFTSIVPLIISFIYVLVAIQSLLGFASLLGGTAAGLATGGTVILLGLSALMIFVIGPIVVLISAGILHLFLKIYGGKGRYADSFKSTMYPYVPMILFGWIPFVNFAVIVWSFILYLFAASTYHKISKLRAFLAWFTMVAIFVAIIVIINLVTGQ